MTARQIEQLRRVLVEQLKLLYHTVHGELRSQLVPGPLEHSEPRDEVDESQRVQARDLEVRRAEGDSARTQQIEEALGRIARGEYGRCVDCGGAIGLERLRLVPWAARDVDCQQAVEAEARLHPPTL